MAAEPALLFNMNYLLLERNKLNIFSLSVFSLSPASDYGLFLSDDDPRKGIWLESGRTLDYYMLRNGVYPNAESYGAFYTAVIHQSRQPITCSHSIY